MADKRYLVFQRTAMEPHEGTGCWTIAHKNPNTDKQVPAQFTHRVKAQEWINTEGSAQRGHWHGQPDQRPFEHCIVEINLPE